MDPADTQTDDKKVHRCYFMPELRGKGQNPRTLVGKSSVISKSRNHKPIPQPTSIGRSPRVDKQTNFRRN